MSESPKKGWTHVAFGDVAKLCRERSADPADDGFDRFVGLEHLDPGDLKIRRWGSVADGTTFTNVFRAGQVLFGKRRAYQHKVAVPDFDGVCSGDIYVFEPKNKHVLPELLPFICQTDRFFDHAVGTSAGSLSPRTNWESLSTYEFSLPPIEEQRRIAEMLLASQAVIENLQDAARYADALYVAAGMKQFSHPGGLGVRPEEWILPDWRCDLLEDLVLESAPICYGIVQVGDHDPSGVPTLAIKNLRGNFSNGIHCTRPSIEAQYSRSRVEPGDVLLSIKATIGDVAIVPEGFRGNISRDLARIRLNQGKIRPEYFLHLYRSPCFLRYVNSLIVGSTRAELSIATIRQMAVPLPQRDEQDRIVNQMEIIFRAKIDLDRRVEHAFCLNRQILDAGLS